ncbi:MAG: cytochrome c maturation protein CcmE [Acidobacteriota bacterium]
MNRKKLYILGGVLLLAFAGFSLASFSTALTPYVSFDAARGTNRMVQVAGALDKGSSSYDMAAGTLNFTLKDPAKQMLRVSYKGVRPANFEDAISIVAIGNWDPQTKELKAQKLLVKCPSKYQGAEVKTYS